LKEEALDRTQWRTHIGRDYRPVVIQTTEWNECCDRGKLICVLL
jgi:hypothetical protein